MLPVSGEQHEKAIDVAGWEETHALGRIGSEAAEVAVAAYFESLAAQGVRLVDAREVAEWLRTRGEMLAWPRDKALFIAAAAEFLARFGGGGGDER
jgi:hypothetical protein